MLIILSLYPCLVSVSLVDVAKDVEPRPRPLTHRRPQTPGAGTDAAAVHIADGERRHVTHENVHASGNSGLRDSNSGAGT